MQSPNKRVLDIYKKNGGTKNRTKASNAVGLAFEAAPNLLMSCHNAWQSLSTWRDEIRRNEQFAFGDQHSDRVYDPRKARYVTERKLFEEQGLNPSQYNIIRSTIRTICGLWSSNKTLPACVAQLDNGQAESDILTATMHALYRKNELWKLDYSLVVQLLLTGLMATDNNFANRNGDSDVVNDYIDPFTFFVDNNMRDPRYLDCTLVGYYYDLPIDSIAGIFSKGNRTRAQAIRNLYSGSMDERIINMTETFTDERLEKDFFHPGIEGHSLGRVIKVIRKETAPCYWVHDHLHGTYEADFISTEEQLKERLQARIAEQEAMGVQYEDMLLIEWEWSTDTFWKYYYLTPFGDILESQDNPYWHEKPSITFELHEFFVGKIYPFVKDLIDTQKQINKLSAISELLSKFSAKSLLFISTKSIADKEGYGIDYIEDRITDWDAVIPYDGGTNGTNPKPEFVSTIAQAFTPLNVVNMYLRLSENVSSVYGALQGQQPSAGTPAQMYAQQSQNSATSLNGIFECVNSFRTRRDKMNVQLMQQFYKDKKWIYDKDSGKRLMYDPERVRNIDVEVNVVENTDTPAYRLMINQMLMDMKPYDVNNTLDFRGMVEVGNFPFKDKLLNYINEREQQMAQGMPGAPMPPDLQAELGQYQFNPALVNQAATLPPEIQQGIIADANANMQ